MDSGQLPSSAAMSSWFAVALRKTRNIVTVTDREDRVVWVNEAFEIATGYTLAEARGRRPAEFLQGVGTDRRAHERIEAAVREQREFEGEIQNYRRDGTPYWVWLSITPILDEAGDFEGFITIQTDITKRKRLESDLAKFRLALQRSNAIVMLTDGDDRIEWVNDRFVELTGYTFDEAHGRRPADLLRGPETDPDVALRVDASATGHEVFEGELYNYRKDGTGFWVSITGTPIYDGGEFKGYIGICVDITERKLFEAEIRRLKDAEIARLEFAMRKSRNSVTITDPEDRIEWVNEGFTLLAGYGLEEVRGRQPKDFMPGEATDRETVARIGEAVRERRSFEGEVYNYRKDGTGYWAWISLTPLYEEPERGERFKGFITIHVDVTDRKRLEAELAETIAKLRVSQRAALESERRATEANAAKSAFLANMSHELRTPLNAILGFVQLLERDDSLTQEHRDTLGIVTRSGEHLLGLINDILSISKIETGKLTLNEQTFDLRRLLRGIEEMIRNRAHAKQLQFLWDVDECVPQFVRGDEGKLRQVLINLLGNAVKFTEVGGVAFRARWDASASDAGGRATFEIEDTGFGIASKDLGHLFEAFMQTESGRQTQEGTGLGLAISQHFARMMEGEIRVKSEVGAGSLFSFEVPLAAAAAAAGVANPLRVMSLEPGQGDYRILIVDDVWENRAFLARLLRSVGFQVWEAANGNEAVEAWRAWRPHLIWMDIRMPVMDGYEATRAIRNAECRMMNDECQKSSLQNETPSSIHHSSFIIHHSTKILALTASAFEHDRETILEAGCDDYVAKPFREAALFAKLEEHLGVRFRYENVPPSGAAAGPWAAGPRAAGPGSVLTPERLGAIPRGLVAELGEVALLGDMVACHDVIDRIQLYDDAAAAELRDLVRGYRFDQIQTLIA